MDSAASTAGQPDRTPNTANGPQIGNFIPPSKTTPQHQITLGSVGKLRDDYHKLSTDFYTLKNQLGDDQRFQQFASGFASPEEWAIVENFLNTLTDRLKFGRPMIAQEQVQDFPHCVDRFGYLRGELDEMRRQIEGSGYQYDAEDLHYRLIGNQNTPRDSQRGRKTASKSRVASAQNSASASPSIRANGSQRSTAQDPRKDLNNEQNNDSGFESSPVAVRSRNTPVAAVEYTRRRLFQSSPLNPSQVAATRKNKILSSPSSSYSSEYPNEQLQYMANNQLITLIVNLQAHQRAQDERIAQLEEEIEAAMKYKEKRHAQENELMQRVKELTEALGRNQ
ncbi:hypothetical protein BJ878DRAFT_102212 [Calycina marina]|uniref:Uncharacterized protein n=1 Tax=Calycina marina TaxID=1763456 RepID=A0A9P7Z2W9_9HELO|nr:hypothetical protein BJ878DRAFT_102212 [Calycina marina]